MVMDEKLLQEKLQVVADIEDKIDKRKKEFEKLSNTLNYLVKSELWDDKNVTTTRYQDFYSTYDHILSAFGGNKLEIHKYFVRGYDKIILQIVHAERIVCSCTYAPSEDNDTITFTPERFIKEERWLEELVSTINDYDMREINDKLIELTKQAERFDIKL